VIYSVWYILAASQINKGCQHHVASSAPVIKPRIEYFSNAFSINL